ncbi:MAG: ADP-ribosyl-(dinitrogen reductase) hydrolase [Rhodobacteraceae bacterium]|nr:MAG: ADP-ribosyl-(dinitrogen reductase) hydrolase [Paracoccaceae bacterium]
MRTSQTHPLRIDSLTVSNGDLGLTLCPGKKGDSVFGAPWGRDLDVDIMAIQDWGAEIVLTLVEPHEFDMLGVPGFAEKMRAAFDWHHLPIRDLHAPDADFEQAWADLAPRVGQCLFDGGRVLVHCRGGLGRAGTVAARILLDQGMAAKTAIGRIRRARKGAIETPVQEQYLANIAANDPGVMARRFEASLLAGAIGDALGAEIEFWSLNRIRQTFPDGLHDLPVHGGNVGTITDDTQMTLFTAEGLISAHIRSHFKGICHPPSVVHHALMRWYATQGGRPQMQISNEGLIVDPRLQHRRAPGNTCLSALGASRQFGDMARNDSKGCGTIMRVSPVAFSGADDVAVLAKETSALTHGHVTGQEAAAAWALILHDVLGGGDPETAARAIGGRFGRETDRAISHALNVPRDGRAETVETLGGGWIAEEALAISLYACLCAENLEHGLTIAVTHSGDSDSTGAIAGNLLGLMFPDQVFAHRWAGQVECRDLIARIAHDLTSCCFGQYDELTDRYPGW